MKKNIFSITPFVGTNNINFGMSSEEISYILGINPLKIKKGGVKNYIDEYPFGFIYYDDNGKCEGIELFYPATVVFENNIILNNTTEQVMSLFKSKHFELVIENKDVFYSPNYSIGIYGENGEVMTVFIGKKGCYNEI